MIKGVNTALAEVDTVYFGKSMYREDVSTIFFPNDVILGLDNGDGFIYRCFKESFLAMIQAFKKQF